MNESIAAELEQLRDIVRAAVVPGPGIPGWASITAQEYERSARRLQQSIAEVAELLGDAAWRFRA